MAGNEVKVIEYLFNNLGKIKLNHIGILKKIGNPDKDGKIINLNKYDDLKKVKTQASLKKADIYLNEEGVSVKQSGGNFPYNRLQRVGLLKVLYKFEIENADMILDKFDEEIKLYHNGIREDRNIEWNKYFTEQEFKNILKYLMMDGYPNKLSKFPAKYILEAPRNVKKDDDIKVFTFEEFFNEYKEKIVFSIRRQWVGQESNSEHKRALGLIKILLNTSWVFDDVVGQPSGWRDDFEEEDRKTVYFVMIEKLK